jgi:hypothetical protein
MPKVEIYRARGGRELTPEAAAASPAGAASPFTIEVRFVGGLTEPQKAAFAAAANRWTKVIVGDLPSVNVEGEEIDDVVIVAQGEEIDGAGQILGQAGPTALRPRSAGKSALLPAKGIMTFDSADLAEMEADGSLGDVITHEMGHVLGIGTIWELKRLLKGARTNNPRFVGRKAREEFVTLQSVRQSGRRLSRRRRLQRRRRARAGNAKAVPVENQGGPGTRNGHWREAVFANELMTGFVDVAPNPLSRLTVASLQDMGYDVDLNAAEPYQIPSVRARVAMGVFRSRVAEPDRTILPTVPTVLPEDSLR